MPSDEERYAVSITNRLLAFYAILAVLLLCLVGALLLMQRETKLLSSFRERRFHSHLLAEELRRSSDDLTRMARTYVVTGDERYKEYFYTIVSIRDGLLKRPTNYPYVLWDLVTGGYDYSVDGDRAVSLVDLMTELKFSGNELALLSEAKSLSDRLVQIETQAFNAMRGIYKDEQGEYSVTDEPNPTLAQELLFGVPYHRQKAAIMGKINTFFLLLDTRTLQEVERERRAQSRLMVLIMVLLALLIGVIGTGFVYSRARIVVRLRHIIGWVNLVEQGEYNIQLTIPGNDEIGLLARTFVNMSTIVSQNIEELETTLANIKTLKGLLPICAHCKQVRDDEGYWHKVEVYIRDRTEADFSHGICPKCMKERYPDIALDDE
jgi:CHASE3 domain sensor protein